MSRSLRACEICVVLAIISNTPNPAREMVRADMPWRALLGYERTRTANDPEHSSPTHSTVKRNSTPRQHHHTSLVVGELPPKLKLPIRNAIASPT